jgi:uracil-DNA glycosylase
VLRADTRARVLLIGQAPGRKVHASGVDWSDASGDRLRAWLGLDAETFYGPTVAVVPMGFCYPGKGASGDLPPRPECAPLWHHRVLPLLRNVKLTVLIGAYAQEHVLGEAAHPSLTQTVRDFARYLPRMLPLPHPSPRNGIWQRKNPWFDAEVIPALRRRVKAALKG